MHENDLKCMNFDKKSGKLNGFKKSSSVTNEDSKIVACIFMNSVVKWRTIYIIVEYCLTRDEQ